MLFEKTADLRHVQTDLFFERFRIGEGTLFAQITQKFDAEFRGECGRFPLFAVGFRAAEVVVEVDRDQPVSESFAEMERRQERTGAVGAAGEAGEECAGGERAKKSGTIFELHL